MIFVDVCVPSIDRVFDFKLDEKVRIENIIEEICKMIEKEENSLLYGDTGNFELCDREMGRALLKSQSLADCGVTDGASLILV